MGPTPLSCSGSWSTSRRRRRREDLLPPCRRYSPFYHLQRFRLCVCGRIGGDPSFFTMRKTKRRKTKDKSCILSYVNVLDSITRDSTIPLPSGKERRTSVLIVAGYFLAIFIRTNFYPIDYIPFDRLYRNVISCCNDHVFYHRSKSN